jgi:integration host factor subunit beta
MTKAELVDKVAATLQLPKHQTATVVNLFLQCIMEALEHGDKVELRGFGSFRLRHRRARVARNPHTGAAVQIPAKRIPWFTVGKALHEMVQTSGGTSGNAAEASQKPRRAKRAMTIQTGGHY